MKQLFLVFVTLILAACATTPSAEVKTETLPTSVVDTPPVKVPQQKPVPVLSWEVPSGERAAWSKALIGAIEEHYASLSKAKDVKEFCPKADKLSKDELVKAWAELFVGMALHESNFNPKTDYYEKTMGYYSRGLYQLSYEDESWAKCGFDRNTKNIYDPSVNIRCAVKIMARQINLKGEVFVSKGVYWAVIREGGKYQKIKEITNRIKKSAHFCY